MTWGRVSICPVVIVITTIVVAIVAAVISAVVATVTSAVSTVLVIAAPLRIVSPLSTSRVAAVVSRLCRVVAAVTLGGTCLVVCLLAVKTTNIRVI